jgi:hypothetical protein
MSKALRGDFERLRGRGVATTLAPADAQHAEPALDDVEPEPVTETAADEPPAIEDVEADEPRQGWLDRLLGR